MNNNKLNSDEFTKKLISKSEIQQPTDGFTKNVMNRILMDPAVKISFISKDDKQSNIGLVISIGVMILGFLIFYFIKYGLDFSQISDGFHEPAYLKALTNFFSSLWNELSFSPYILIALIGVIFLVFIDKTVVKYLYSI
ncbi:hypothetical protein ACFLSE_04585 [Bacteroidota bacterium]